MNHNASTFKNLRSVRSYVLRQSRITPSQQKALNDWWEMFGIEIGTTFLDVDRLFNQHLPVILEIGFGMGESLLLDAKQNPEFNYIGIEVHLPGVGRLLSQLHLQQITNVRVFHHDAIEVLQKALPDQSLHKVQIFFPDPWPKKRHHKRRLIQPEFIGLLAKKLKPNGILHIATDWEEYACYILNILNASSDFTNDAGVDFAPRPSDRPLTKFEHRGKKLGHRIWDIIFRRH